jgi:glycosyltransferase involved in cell wall biosynthesis
MYLLINLSRSFGGAEKRVIETAQYMDGRRECGVVVLEGSFLHQRLIKKRIRVFPLAYSRADPRMALAISKIIKRHCVTLIDTHNPQSHFWGIIGTKLVGGTGLLSTVHSSQDETLPYLKTEFYEIVLRCSNLAGTHFVAVSESVRDFLVGLGVGYAKITLIPNGLDCRNLSPMKCLSVVKKITGWSSEHFIVIVVGRLEPIKGHRYVIEALPEILTSHPHVRCLIVGTGRNEQKLKDLVGRLGLKENVHFSGFRSDISKLLVECDLFCMPSLSEGLPFALLEACANRIPVLCSRVGGIPEVLEHNRSAKLIPPGEPAALAEGIRAAIENPLQFQEMASQAWLVVKEKYDITKTLSRTVETYDIVSSH